MKNHKDIRIGDGVKQTHVDYNTKLIIRMATREDSGSYILTAENINGKDTAYAEVTVLGKTNKYWLLKLYFFSISVVNNFTFMCR